LLGDRQFVAARVLRRDRLADAGDDGLQLLALVREARP
jgi:hypothetical protein